MSKTSTLTQQDMAIYQKTIWADNARAEFKSSILPSIFDRATGNAAMPSKAQQDAWNKYIDSFTDEQICDKYMAMSALGEVA